MNRRALLQSVLGYPTTTETATLEAPSVVAALPPDSGLAPYTGEWNKARATHLLRRCMFGPTLDQIEEAAQSSMDAVVAQLLADLPTPGLPLNINPDDTDIPIGETWVDAVIPRNSPDLIHERRFSLRAWLTGVILEEGVSIREKMTLFWLDHFVVELFVVRDPTFMYNHIALMREYATGDFRELVKKATLSPAMLRYLNGNDNKKDAPNENYARELFELFTVGKGDLAGEGDYSTFTELDVAEAAKALTGWKDEGFYKRTADQQIGAKFNPRTHDTSTKQLSHRFNNARIPNGGDNEYADLIDVIFESPAVANFLAEKLYRYFIYYNINAEVRRNVIEPLAQVIRENDYQLKPVLEVLLKSEHFQDSLNRGPMIKNPIDFIAAYMKQFEIEVPGDLTRRYTLWKKVYKELESMQMELLDPPDVAGWKAYYQEPLFYRIWINSVTLPIRAAFAEKLATNGLRVGAFRTRVEVLTFVEKVSDPSDPNAVVQEFATLIYPQPLTQPQLDALKNILVPGLPDFEWTIEYEEYKNNPNDNKLAASIEKKLRDLVSAMVTMAEYYLS